MKTAAQPTSYNANYLNASDRKEIAFKVIQKEKPITKLAWENEVSRKFIYAQNTENGTGGYPSKAGRLHIHWATISLEIMLN